MIATICAGPLIAILLAIQLPQALDLQAWQITFLLLNPEGNKTHEDVITMFCQGAATETVSKMLPVVAAVELTAGSPAAICRP
jgi:hypothetical protein